MLRRCKNSVGLRIDGDREEKVDREHEEQKEHGKSKPSTAQASWPMKWTH